MKLKDLRKNMMNGVMDALRYEGPLTHAMLLRKLLPAFDGLNEATVSAALTARLEELVERSFVQVWVPGTWHETDAYYEPSDRMFDENGDYWIGHKLIDIVWPPYYGKEEKKK